MNIHKCFIIRKDLFYHAKAAKFQFRNLTDHLYLFVVFWHSMGPYLNDISGLNLADSVFINAFTNNTNLIFMLISGYFGMHFHLEKLIRLDLCIIFMIFCSFFCNRKLFPKRTDHLLYAAYL